MSRLIILVVLFLTCNTILLAQNGEKLERWHRSGGYTFGVDVDGAERALKAKRANKVVVAMIGAGVSPDEELFRDKLWINSDEIPNNGVDDDKNGFIDDVNGWNFIGNTNEEYTDMDRAFFSLYKKYENISLGEKLRDKDAAYFFDVIAKSSNIGRKFSTYKFLEYINYKMGEYIKELKVKLPENEDFISKEFVANIKMPTPEENMLDASVCYYIGVGLSSKKDMGIIRYQKAVLPLISQAKNDYLKELSKVKFDRITLGDNLDVINDIKGNGDIFDNSKQPHGSIIKQGIISDVASVNGVNQLEFMAIKVVPSTKADSYDKDYANAIRYAVDNGADVIDLIKSKFIFTRSTWLEEAAKYAESKGVMIVVSAGDGKDNIDSCDVFPMKQFVNGDDCSLVLRVATYDNEGFPSVTTSYGAKSVDLFAPGAAIVTNELGDTYNKISSSTIASSFITGVYALIKSYYPSLSPMQIKEAILNGVDNKKGVNVIPPVKDSSQEGFSLVDFGSMSISGGVINVLKAINFAENFNINNR